MFKFFMVDSSPDRVKPKTIKLVFVAYPLGTQHQGEKIGWLGIMIMCGDTFLPIDSCFKKIKRMPVGLVLAVIIIMTSNLLMS